MIHCLSSFMLISPLDLIKQSIALYRSHAKLFIAYMGLLFIPAAISIILSIWGTLNYANGSVAFILLAILFAAVYISSAWISLAFLRVMVKAYEGVHPAPIQMELKAAVHLLIPSLWVAILTALYVLGGFLLLIIPGIIFTVWYGFTFYTVAIDGKRGTEAMRASKLLVKGRWWSVVWRLIIPALAFGLILLIADSIVTGIAGLFVGDILPQKKAVLFSGTLTLISTMVSLLLTPLSTAAVTILYENLKKTRS